MLLTRRLRLVSYWPTVLMMQGTFVSPSADSYVWHYSSENLVIYCSWDTWKFLDVGVSDRKEGGQLKNEHS